MLFSQKRTAAAWLLLTCAVLLLQLLSQAAAAAGPPLELSKWNRAYKLTVSNIDSKLEDQYNLIEQTCVKGTGFESNAAAAPLDACRYRQEKNGTYTKWIKKAGEWRMNTNCYCYALNVYRDGFCIPGRSSRAVTDALMSGQEKTCKLMTAAVLADGAKPVTRAQALSAAQPPAGSHYIGLLVRKRSCMPMHCWQNDFHLVRKDDNGKWSWKEPGVCSLEVIFGFPQAAESYWLASLKVPPVVATSSNWVCSSVPGMFTFIFVCAEVASRCCVLLKRRGTDEGYAQRGSTALRQQLHAVPLLHAAPPIPYVCGVQPHDSELNHVCIHVMPADQYHRQQLLCTCCCH
jgi:hypothetical protein